MEHYALTDLHGVYIYVVRTMISNKTGYKIILGDFFLVYDVKITQVQQKKKTTMCADSFLCDVFVATKTPAHILQYQSVAQ